MSSSPRSVHPKLRIFEQSSPVENAVRAAGSASLGVRPDVRLRVPEALESASVVQTRRDAAWVADVRAALDGEGRDLGHGDLGAEPALPESLGADAVRASVFVHLREDGPLSPDAWDRAREVAGQVRSTGGRRNLRTLLVSQADIAALREDPAVALVEPAEGLQAPLPEVGAAHTSPRARWSPPPQGSAVPTTGDQRVLIGIIDVGGFDFSHPDFLVPGLPPTTRFLKIWDQGGTFRPPPRDPRDRRRRMFDYGSEIDQAHMNAALAAASIPGFPPAWELERQSVMTRASHGTHVASTAAGNSGACPDALIAAVLLSLDDVGERTRSFYDSSRVVHAAEYLFALGEDLGVPVVINISLGTNGHAHDASSAGSRWLDALLSSPGRAICVAAGNAGQESGETADDFGWTMGRIHSEGRLAGPGLSWDLEWLVWGDGVEDLSENELELWYSAQDRFEITVRTPDGRWLPPVVPGAALEHHPVSFTAADPLTGQARASRCFVSVYSELYSPSNGANYVGIYLSPEVLLDAHGRIESVSGVQPGGWVVRVRGLRVRDGGFHAWIERDDPRDVGTLGGRRLMRFPSFFSRRSNVDRSSVSSLACGHRVVSVANFDQARERVHRSSSQGPTRDGRRKPDVAAPGTDVVAARGFSEPGEARWVAMTGTSMASPFVAGVVAHMLQRAPALTAAQVTAIVRATAQPLPGADYRWQTDAGFGAIQPDACLAECGEV